MSESSRTSSWGFYFLTGALFLCLAILVMTFVPVVTCPSCEGLRMYWSRLGDPPPECVDCEGKGRVTLFSRWKLERNQLDQVERRR